MGRCQKCQEKEEAEGVGGSGFPSNFNKGRCQWFPEKKNHTSEPSNCLVTVTAKPNARLSAVTGWTGFNGWVEHYRSAGRQSQPSHIPSSLPQGVGWTLTHSPCAGMGSHSGCQTPINALGNAGGGAADRDLHKSLPQSLQSAEMTSPFHPQEWVGQDPPLPHSSHPQPEGCPPPPAPISPSTPVAGTTRRSRSPSLLHPPGSLLRTNHQ